MSSLTVLRLMLRGFATHNDTTIELPPTGIVLVTGANGSGKSTIIDGVAECLWHETVRDSPLWREKEAGRLVVDAQGVTAVRERAAGGSTSLKWAAGAGAPTVWESMTKAQAQLSLLIGTYEQWRRTHVLCADDGAAFTRAPDSARKAVLEQMLGIEGFEDAASSVHKDRRETDKRASTALATLDSAEKQMARAEARIEHAPPKADVDAARARLADAAASEAVMLSLAQGLSDNAAVVREACQRAGADDLRARVSMQEYARTAPPTETPACGSCQQPVSAETAARLRAAWQPGMEGKRAVAKLAEEGHRSFRIKLDAACAASDAAAENYRAAEAVTRAAREALNAELEREKTARLWKGVADEYFDASAVRDESAEAAARAEHELAVLHAVEKVLGPNGVRSVLLSDALLWLTDLANEWLTKISLSKPMRVSIEPYMEKQGGGVRNAVTIKVMGAGKGTYKSCSRGEQRRLDIAILLALSTLSQRVRGVTPGTMFVDEILDAIDDEGAEAVCDALNEMARSRCIVVISHNESVRRALKPAVELRVSNGEVTRCR